MSVNPRWLHTLLSLALPVTLQTALFSSKSMVDTVMLGQLNPLDMAALGLATKAQMIVSFCVIGVSMGGGQILAQCFNKQVNDKFIRAMLIMLGLAIGVGLLCAVSLALLSQPIMAFGSTNPTILERGADYLLIISPTLVLFAIALTAATVLRTMFKPVPATVISFIGVALNIGFNILLIEQYGMKGVAYGTLLAASIETLLLLSYVHCQRWFPIQKLVKIASVTSLRDSKVVAKLSLIAALNTVIWSFGLYVFHALLGKTSDDLLIALGALAPIESLTLALLIGFATAASVIIGNHSGQRDTKTIRALIPRYITLSLLTGLMLSLTLFALKPLIIDFITDQALHRETTANLAFNVMLLSISFKGLSMMFILGILRAGGDAKFCLWVDIFCQWGFLLPCTALFISLNIRLEYILLLVVAEECLKITLCTLRLHFGDWIKVHADHINA
ncbi:Na+ driven multidrug efflux pump [Vibrio maritimus]|uniref:Na+ driven multidrug efflux pump n=1 Tax=Vibrio maritimus TaxID=990268 RepID=A0A090TE78_9VIBR|nr:Na+ driven multidrug efflux pump [Vibrio maritimus]